MTLQRFKLTIEYDGTAFAGWQRQENAPSVQQAVEEALAKFMPAFQAESLQVAGRTDAGVHALGQVAHVDLPENVTETTVRRALNFYLDQFSISIIKAEKVGPEFHARFSAKKRTYLYRIVNRPDKLALDCMRAWHVPFALDIEKMQQGALALLGCHDFSAFRTVHCQAKNPVRTLEKLEVRKIGDQIEFYVEAPSFLHHQVRNMVGTLVDVGRGKYAPLYVKKILESKDRALAGPTAPAHALYFIKVDY
ncbi:MAG: tRNA pseudouridine(38-40) synthase TruA [Alphaproteobacteria bacterium]